MNLNEFVRWGADTTLTERQAEAYVRRVIEMEPREAVAEHMSRRRENPARD